MTERVYPDTPEGLRANLEAYMREYRTDTSANLFEAFRDFYPLTFDGHMATILADMLNAGLIESRTSLTDQFGYIITYTGPATN